MRGSGARSSTASALPRRALPRQPSVQAMAAYVSDITKFIADLKKQKPALEDEQRRGRSIYWDREPIDLDTMQRARDSQVPQQPYVYQTTR